MKSFLVTSALCLLVTMAAAPDALAADATQNSLKESYRRPGAIPFPDKAIYSPQMATLGKMLFFEPRLSGAQNLSCASCHNPSFGFEVPVPGAIGSANTPLARKSNTILNAAWSTSLFWDGACQVPRGSGRRADYHPGRNERQVSRHRRAAEERA